jgi:seryl-tRNA synthetase
MALFNEHKEGKMPTPWHGAAANDIANYNSENLRREVNALIKEIGQIKKNKGNADELIAKKAEMDKEVAALTVKANELVKKRDAKAFLLGNIVDKNSAVSTTEVCDLMGLKYES